MKNLLLILTVFTFNFSFSQRIIPINYSGTNENLQSIIAKEPTLSKDSVIFRKQIQPLEKHKDLKLNIIAQIFLANWLSNRKDALNKESAFLYKNAIDNANKSGDASIKLWTSMAYASYLYQFRDYESIVNPLLETYQKTKQIQPNKIIQPYQTYRLLGWTLSTFNNHQEALESFKMAKKFTESGSKENSDVLSFIGGTYLKLNQIDLAKKMFVRSANIAKKQNHQSRLAKSIGYLAEIELIKKNNEKAKELYKQDIQISQQAGDQQNTMYALIELSKIFLLENNATEAFRWLQAAKGISLQKSYFKSSEREILILELAILDKLPGPENELNIRRRLQALEDSLKKTDGEMQVNRVNWMIQKSKYEDEIKSKTSLAQEQSFFKNIFLSTGIITFLILVIIYIDRKKLQESKNLYLEKVKNFENEKEILENELNDTNLGLENQIEFISKRNAQITLLAAELQNYKTGQYKKFEKKSGKRNNLLESHLMTEENWLNFKNAFRKEESETFNAIIAFPEITESNLRIVLLQKLGYGNTEIAGLLGITPDAVKKSKQRLRKKLGEKYEELEDLVNTPVL